LISATTINLFSELPLLNNGEITRYVNNLRSYSMLAMVVLSFLGWVTRILSLGITHKTTPHKFSMRNSWIQCKISEVSAKRAGNVSKNNFYRFISTRIMVQHVTACWISSNKSRKWSINNYESSKHNKEKKNMKKKREIMHTKFTLMEFKANL